MNWEAFRIALLTCAVIAGNVGLIALSLKLTDKIYWRYGLDMVTPDWAYAVGVVPPVALFLALVAGVIVP